MHEAQDIFITKSMYVTKEAMADGYAEASAHVRLVRGLSEFIANEKVESIEHGDSFTTEFKLSLYVASPDEFWNIVREEAMKLASPWGGCYNEDRIAY